MAMIVENNHPFTLVEESRFIQFVHSLNSSFQPLRLTAMKNKIASTFLRLKAQLIEELKNADNGMFSATTDLWSCNNNYSTMTVTITWLDANFLLQSIIIGYFNLKGDLSGANIAKHFLEVLKEFQLESKVVK